jgi:hypothetical protein
MLKSNKDREPVLYSTLNKEQKKYFHDNALCNDFNNLIIASLMQIYQK